MVRACEGLIHSLVLGILSWFSIGSGVSLADPMSATSFVEYASSADLTLDEIYTIELLIDRVRSRFDEAYTWDERNRVGELRLRADYQPQFFTEHLEPAERVLQGLTWLSFQGEKGRPVRDLTALRYLSALRGVALAGNEITDISPLAHCRDLRRIFLREDGVKDISALAGCDRLEELELGSTPIENFSALESMVGLRELSISAAQLLYFKQVARVPSLRKLELGLGSFQSFENFPEMPELRAIWGADVRSLEGVEKFPKLENLTNLTLAEAGASLEPLRAVTHLTHANIFCISVESLEPLSKLYRLRDFSLYAETEAPDFTPLDGLPALHEVVIKCDSEEVPGLDKLRATLPAWDVEFRAAASRHTPSLALEVVEQDVFDLYDSIEPFNVEKEGENHGLLSSELDWLDEQIDDILCVDFDEDEDYAIPYQWNGARSRTVVLYGERAVEAFPRLVLAIQEVLGWAKKDWIIYFQSDEVEAEDDFTVWIYPDRIMVTQEYEATVRRLISIR